MRTTSPQAHPLARLAPLDRCIGAVAAVAAIAAVASWSAVVLVELPEGPGAIESSLALVSDLTAFGTLMAAVAATGLIALAIRKRRG